MGPRAGLGAVAKKENPFPAAVWFSKPFLILYILKRITWIQGNVILKLFTATLAMQLDPCQYVINKPIRYKTK
jgi:hypothetical protein